MEVNLLQMTGVDAQLPRIPAGLFGPIGTCYSHTGEDVGKVFSVIWGALDGLPESTGTWQVLCPSPGQRMRRAFESSRKEVF